MPPTEFPTESPADGILACPVCHHRLRITDRIARCAQGHSFDRAREGYLNLLTPGKSRARAQGDGVEMVSSRRAFLDAGHYRVLSEGLATWVGELRPQTLLDVGCGEGTFTQAMLAAIGADDRGQLGDHNQAAPDERLVAFDISRPAVKLTARRIPRAVSAVASVNALPAMAGSVELVTSVMSPMYEPEFARVLAPGGRVLLVTPGDSHLAELRALLYRDYRAHDEQVLLAQTWPVLEQRRFTATAHLSSPADIMQVWGMTPYRWNAPLDGVERLQTLTELTITVHFVGTLLAAPSAEHTGDSAPEMGEENLI